jgi:hypothetical protein
MICECGKPTKNKFCSKECYYKSLNRSLKHGKMYMQGMSCRI